MTNANIAQEIARDTAGPSNLVLKNGASRTDLRDLLTVFVPTVGYPTFEKCLEHLASQDSMYQLRIIDHVAPQSAAHGKPARLHVLWGGHLGTADARGHASGGRPDLL